MELLLLYYLFMGYFIKAKIMGGQIELDKTVYTLPK
jgi:uncharacterized protein YneF (UPF0154 family)